MRLDIANQWAFSGPVQTELTSAADSDGSDNRKDN